jgi:predicted Zn-dependent protease
MLEAYEQLLRIAPNHPSANYYLGVDDLAKGANERAIGRFRRTQAAEPAAARAWIGEARAWVAIGDRAKARDALQGALRADPSSQEARDLLASLAE